MDIEEDIKKVIERFNNGTEKIEDILKYCRNFKLTFENGIKLQLVEKKYLDRLIEEYKKLLAEREEDKKRIEELEEHQQKFYNGEIYTAKQLKQVEENQKKYFINKQKVNGYMRRSKE